MSLKTFTAVGLAALTVTLAPMGRAASDRERVVREGRQIVRENRITAHQIQIESQRGPKQAPPPTLSKTLTPGQAKTPQTPRR